MIKLVVSDVDGTLVEDGGRDINPKLLETILRLRERGMQFAVASGRQVLSIEKLFEPVRSKIFYLADNGAYVGCYGRILFTTPLDRQAAMRLIQDVRQLGDCELLVGGPRMEYVETQDEKLLHWLIHGYGFSLTQVKDLTQVEDEIIKVSIYRKHSVMERAGHLVKKYQGALKGAMSGDMWIDFMSPDVNKGNAVKLLQDSLEILPEETMVFGDQLNDVEMMRQAYYSFAMGNARDEVKEAARFVTDRNTEDGVLKVLQRLLEEQA